MVQTNRFIRKPLYVDAVRVTGANFQAIAEWCQGEVLREETPGPKKGKKFIRVRVHLPKHPRQTQAFVGDWILYTETGYKVYTDKAFKSSFDPVTAEEGHLIQNAELKSVGPVVADPSSSNGVGEIQPEPDPQRVVDHQAVVADHDARIRAAVGDDVELVPATPESVATAILENDQARRADLDIPTGVSITDGAQNLREQTVETVPEQESIEPSAAEGRRVLSIEEQENLTSDEVQELVRSGEAVLAQDIAQP